MNKIFTVSHSLDLWEVFTVTLVLNTRRRSHIENRCDGSGIRKWKFRIFCGIIDVFYRKIINIIRYNTVIVRSFMKNEIGLGIASY